MSAAPMAATYSAQAGATRTAASFAVAVSRAGAACAAVSFAAAVFTGAGVAGALGGCASERPDGHVGPASGTGGAIGSAAGPAAADGPHAERHAERARMVDLIEAHGVRDAAVLAAMRRVPRHEFVPAAMRAHAYEDRPLPIDEEQTISQPYIVALMTELAGVRPGARVLEVGTGSGYQAAVLAELGADVYSIEIVEPLARTARERLARLGYERVKLRTGDGYRGWPEAAPFDAIVVTAAPPAVPPPLKEQLAPGGRLVIPVGDEYQELLVVTRTAAGFDERRVVPVRFVPMTGEALEGEKR